MRSTLPRSPLVLFALLVVAWLPGVAIAQTPPRLDQRCTVTVLNRTVRVNPDGTWVLPNIPANSGRVKARATCVQNGVTRFGESDYFTVPKNGIVTPPKIILGIASAIPANLSLAPAQITLAGVGQTQQVTVTATYPDGSTRDVSAESSGTDYTTSNSAIATITANGLVTAIASGTVVIQAINDGSPGMMTAKVVLSTTDTDGDGIPDDVEVSQGMDPRNRVDALEDFDRDNLTNLDEYSNGTDLRNPDSDGDGLLDGDEVRTHHTNPLVADTDGDLIPDGVEVQTASNPLNRNSYDLRRATRTSTIAPSPFLLTTNLLVHGEVSVQLSWQVTLIDGKTTIDLIADQRTQIASNSITVCNFGTERGRVFAGQAGDCVITLANGTLGASVNGAVKSFTPNALSYVDLPGSPNSVRVRGDFAYIAAGAAGLQIVDVSNRTAPHIAASRALPGNANDVAVEGNFAYVAAGNGGLQIVNIANPLAPTVAGFVATGATGTIAWDVAVKNNRAYVANGSGGLVIVDVSSPSAPVRLGSIALAGTSKGVDVDTDRMIAVVVRGRDGLSIVNVANPASPAVVATLSDPTRDLRDVVVSGTFAFLADFEKSFTSLDLTNPAVPVIVASTPLDTGGRLVDVALLDGIAVGADVLFVNGVPMIDVGDPANPTPRAILDFRRFRDDNGIGVALDSAFVYLAAALGIQENAASGNSGRLYIGQYRSDDQTPPTVTIESPAPGDSILEGAILPVSITATDNFAIASVSVLLDRQLVAVTNTAPYQVTVNVPVAASSITLSAQASDFAANVGTSSDVTLTVTRDTERPVVQITAPTAPRTVPEGTVIKETVGASDNVAVTRVEFLLNGLIVATKTAPPYEAFITLPIGPTTFRFGARAFDPAGNAGVASEVVVNVTSDPPPVVRIISPASGISAVEGELLTATIEATDNGAVLSTRFDVLVDGVAVESDLRTLSEYTFGVPLNVQSISLVATAVDNLGQVGTSPPVVISVTSEPAPTVQFVSPAPDTVVVAGSSIPVLVQASDDVAIQFVALDGIGPVFTPPYEFAMTVPAFTVVGSSINLRAIAVDSVGKATFVDLTLPVVPDPLAAVQGSVVTEFGQPVSGADVTVSASGLTAEFFRAPNELSAIPDLNGRTPDLVKLFGTANLAGVYFDPFGIAQRAPWFDAPFTIVRLSGTVKITTAGSYTFSLMSYAAGRLTVNGSRLVDLSSVDVAEPRYGEGTIVLPEGEIPIEVIAVATSAQAQVRLQYAPSGGTLKGIPLDQLTPAYSPYRGTTDEFGAFLIEDVPTVLGGVIASATAVSDTGGPLAGQSAKVLPEPSNELIDVGQIEVTTPLRQVSKAVSLVEIPGFANDIFIYGGIAYIAAGAEGLQRVPLTDVAHTATNAVLLPGNANGVFVGGRIFVAAGTTGLHILDWPAFPWLQPSLAATVPTGGDASSVLVVNQRAYVANGASGLAVIDVRDGVTPRVLGTIAIPGLTKAVDFDLGHLAVVVGSAGLTVVDVQDPAAMRVLSTLPLTNARRVSLHDQTKAIVSTGSSLVIVDFANPLNPGILSELPGGFSDGKRADLTSAGVHTFVAAGRDTSRLVASIVNVRDPFQPAVANRIDFSPLDALLRSDDRPVPANVTGVATDGTFVYATVTDAATENGSTGTSYLYIGQYLVPEDPYGRPPTPSFSWFPGDPPMQQERESVIDLDIYAFDDIAIANVKLFVNGQLQVNIDTPSSREWRDVVTLNIPFAATSVTVRLEVTDVGGNVGTATISPDIATRVPRTGGNYTFLSNLGEIATNGRSVWATFPDNTDGFGVSLFWKPGGEYGFLTSAAGHHRSSYAAVDEQGNAWVSNVDNNTVVEVGTLGGNLRTVTVTSPGHLLHENGHIWVTSGSFNVVKINAATGAIMATFPTGAVNPGVMAFDGANIWIVNKFQNTLSKLRASDGALLGTFATGTNVSGIAFDGTNIWTANRDDGTLSKINAATGASVATITVGSSPSGIVFDGFYLYITQFDATTGSKILPATGEILGHFFTPLHATAILFADMDWFVADDSNHVWVYR